MTSRSRCYDSSPPRFGLDLLPHVFEVHPSFLRNVVKVFVDPFVQSLLIPDTYASK